MNRVVFIICLTLIFVLGLVLQHYQVPAYGFLVLLGGSVLTITRRYYLKLKPIWGGGLKDIPKYFSRP